MATAMRDHGSRAAIARTMLSARNRQMRSCNARMRAYGRPLRGLATIALTSFRRQEPWRTRCLTPSLAQSCDLRSPAAAQPLWLHVCLHRRNATNSPHPSPCREGDGDMPSRYTHGSSAARIVRWPLRSLLPAERVGARGLCSLVTRAKRRGTSPRATFGIYNLLAPMWIRLLSLTRKGTIYRAPTPVANQLSAGRVRVTFAHPMP